MTRLQLRLVEARMRSGLTLAQVSEATGIELNTINGLETGSCVPEPTIIHALADLYEVSADWLRGSMNNSKINLTEIEIKAAKAVNSNDLATFLEQPFVRNGKPLNREAKKKLYVMAQILLDQDD